MSYPDFLLDKRVLLRNIEKGIVDKKLLEKHMAALPNVESKSVPCAPELPSQPTRGGSTDDEG